MTRGEVEELLRFLGLEGVDASETTKRNYKNDVFKAVNRYGTVYYAEDLPRVVKEGERFYGVLKNWEKGVVYIKPLLVAEVAYQEKSTPRQTQTPEDNPTQNRQKLKSAHNFHRVGKVKKEQVLLRVTLDLTVTALAVAVAAVTLHNFKSGHWNLGQAAAVMLLAAFSLFSINENLLEKTIGSAVYRILIWLDRLADIDPGLVFALTLFSIPVFLIGTPIALFLAFEIPMVKLLSLWLSTGAVATLAPYNVINRIKKIKATLKQ